MSDGRRAAQHDPPHAELPLEVQARLADLRARAHADCTHYELLGVARDADRKAIKRAYYGLAALVHPDRHAGRDLGDWKPLMEALFREITIAHDILGDAAQRRAYDELLPPEPAPSSTHMIAPAPSSVPGPISSGVPQPAPSSPQPLHSAPPPSTPMPVSARVPVAPRAAPSDAVRRDTLARRLLAGRSIRRPEAAAEAAPSATPAVRNSPPLGSAPAEELRARAEAAEQRQDAVAALQAWRRLQLLDSKDGDIAFRTAKALMAVKDPNLHEASELAKRAIATDASMAERHLLLAEIYLAAQLPSAARSVLEHALGVASETGELSTLLARVEAMLRASRK